MSDNIADLVALIAELRADAGYMDDYAEQEAESDFADFADSYRRAASEIERLKARALSAEGERDRLREALRPFAAEADARSTLALGPDIDDWPVGGTALTLGDLRRARQALGETK